MLPLKLVLFLAAAVASAHQSGEDENKDPVTKECEPAIAAQGRGHALPPLPQRAKIPLASELRSVGQIVKPGEKLPAHISDGFYVYIVARAGDKEYVVWNERAVVPRSGDSPDIFLANHPAMKQKLEEMLGESVELVGAGEWQTLNAKTSLFSNKSGRFFPTTAHLTHSEEALSKAGLPFLPNTRRHDYSHEDLIKFAEKTHEDAELLSKIIVQVRQVPGLKKRADELAQVYREQWVALPDKHSQNWPGGFDVESIFSAVQKVQEQQIKAGQRAKDPELAGQQLEALAAMQAVRGYGPELAIRKISEAGSDMADVIEMCRKTFEDYKSYKAQGLIPSGS
ncbi:hypothetical protein K2X33_02230 [bacterium]|nr:hypothetical protein [bacterium]